MSSTGSTDSLYSSESNLNLNLVTGGGGGDSAGSPGIIIITSLSVLKVALGIIVILRILHYEDVQGHRVPIFFFKALPSLFQPFVVLIIVALSASILSFTARMRNCNQLARFCCWSSVLSLAAGIVLLVIATVATTVLNLQIGSISLFDPMGLIME